tara:strand:- start:767 stop:1039 length:273 start_codon:yes stop_codon:yes gene_type:complete
MEPAQEKPDSESPAPAPMAEAMKWVAVITSVGLEMIIPILIGSWIDKTWSTSFAVWIGLVLGPTLGFWHLLVLTREKGPGSGSGKKTEDR